MRNKPLIANSNAIIKRNNLLKPNKKNQIIAQKQNNPRNI